MKEFVRKTALFVAALAICTSFIPTSTYAATKETTSASVTVSDVEPVAVVKNYLKAVKSGDTDKAVSILKEVGLTEKQQKRELSELLKDSDAKIVAIKDVTLVEKNNDTVTLSITVQYGDGSIAQSAVSLEKDNGEYKFKRLTTDENVIQKATKTNTNAPKISRSYSQTELVDWNETRDQAGTYYTDSFSAQNISYLLANIWAPINVELVVVKKGYLSDTALTNTVRLSADQDSQQASLSIKSGSSVSNGRLRITQGAGGGTYGELYAIS